MSDLIVSLLAISVIMSSIAVLFHIFRDDLAKKVSSKAIYYTWGIVIISLLIPIRPSYEVAPINVEPELDKTAIDIPSDYQAPVANVAGNNSQSVLSDISFGEIIFGVWLAGAVIFLIYHLVKHIRFLRLIKRWGSPVIDETRIRLFEEIKAELNIINKVTFRESKLITVPMMVGVMKPILVIPSFYISEKQLAFILRHELIHCRRFDLFIKILCLLANAIHWFNPIVYMMNRWVEIDCEIACDTEVLKDADRSEKIKYGETIIEMAKNNLALKTSLSTNFYGGKKTMRKRLESILGNNNKRTVFTVLVVALIIFASVSAGIVIAVENQKNSSSENNVVANAATSKSAITEDDARDIALKESGGGKVVEIYLDNDDGIQKYEVDVIDGNWKYGFDIDEKTGNIISSEKEKINDNQNIVNNSNSSGKIISEEKARSIALDRTDGGDVVSFSLEEDEGLQVYEIDVIKGDWEYSIDIDGVTGKIIDFEKESRYDD